MSDKVNETFLIILIICLALLGLVTFFMIFLAVRYRRKKNPHPEDISGSLPLEIAWTVIPAILVLIMFWYGWENFRVMRKVPEDAFNINVTARMWSWSFEYPEFGIVTDTLYMPVNKQAILHLSSDDVIHSFWVPEFRVKQDALPGGEDFIRDLRVTPTLLGDYKVRCAELCGLRHATMESPVKVVSKEDFDAWVAQEAGLPTDPIGRGERLVKQSGCLACHSLDGTKIVGPTWQGLAGRQESLSDGSVVTVDEAYLRESILDPNVQIVAGFPPGIMPQNFGTKLTPEQINDIIAYLLSLK